MMNITMFLGYLFTAGAIAMLVAGYFFIFWDRRSEDSANKDDGQVGLKLTLYTLLVICVGITAGGLNAVLHFLLSGAKNTPEIKMGLGSLIAGGVAFAGIWFAFMPKTNTADYPKAERYAVGLVAVLSGILTILSLEGLLKGLFGGAPWKQVTSGDFSALVTYGALTFFALIRFGKMSGWVAPVKSPSMPAGFGQQQVQQPMQGYQSQPQQQQGYPPQQQQGYPPQGGGYPPQGGAGGGYPPQGGGGNLPPPGGGYPPQGGGGYPQG